MCQQYRSFVSNRCRNYFSLLVSNWDTGPFFEKCAIVIQRTDIHVGNLKGDLEHRQRRHIRRMGVNDAVHVASCTVEPRVKSICRIGHPSTVYGVQVLVHQQQILRCNFIEAVAERLGVIGVWIVCTTSDLAGESRVMSAVEQNAARESQLLAWSPCMHGEFAIHLGKRPCNDFRLRFIQSICHRRYR